MPFYKTNRDEVLYKNESLEVTSADFATMEMEINSKCMNAWTTVLNKCEEARSPGHPNRLFLYVVYEASKKYIITKINKFIDFHNRVHNLVIKVHKL